MIYLHLQGYFVLLSWLPVYFKTVCMGIPSLSLFICRLWLTTFIVVLVRFLSTQVYNVNLKQAAWFSAVPWGVMALSGYIAGASSDFMIKSGCRITKVRKLMQVRLTLFPPPR